MFAPQTKVLIADDMMIIRNMIKSMLTELGLTNFHEASNGAAAWTLFEGCAESEPFQLIISDWNMPELKGIDFLKKVRAHPTLKSTPFILVTAEAEKSQVMEAIKAGVSNYIPKPFTVATFKDKLEAVHKKWQQNK